MQLIEARVLIVDDESALREVFAKFLRRVAAEVRTAANGEEALAAILSAPIDVLITDVRMPVMTGVELVRKLAGMGRLVPCIIFVSAFADVNPREMYDLGVECFLAKPFKLEELAEAVRGAIAELPERWQQPLAIPPRHSFDFECVTSIDSREAADLESREQTPDLPDFQLGRGGFSIRSPQTPGLGKIAFTLTFARSPQPRLAGQGFVRWRSRAEQTIGIEFAYIEEPGRAWVIEHIASTRPRSFIPAL